MRQSYWIGGIIVLLVLIGGIYFLQNSENDEWEITMKSLGSGSSNWVAPPYCDNETYLLGAADYILDIKVTNIAINPDGAKREFDFEILEWKKGELDFVPRKITVMADYDPQVADDIPFGAFEVERSYTIYLEDNAGEISFVDDLCGIKEI